MSLGGDHVPAFPAPEKAAEQVGFKSLVELGLAALNNDLLNPIIKLLCDGWLVYALVKLAPIIKQSEIEGILKDSFHFRASQEPAPPCCQFQFLGKVPD
ncbi:MAG: hypothetical protein A2901_05695 [Elusimicrobia bacterium RIFCSPLOWO2_01_FULL_54_10]|nr:MAG: hypothetical protein A2901_05695 [Elusimicrobia bacterium RIFCSPLOWO2_01_FULL_54_10]